MLTDRQGNTLTGATAAAVDHFDAALEAFNIYRGDPVGLVKRAIADAPDFAMAHILKAYLYAFATEPKATAKAKAVLVQIEALPLSEREAGHAAALERLLAGEWTAAAVLLDHHNMRYPHDMLALQAGHLIDFYRASARDLRDRIARVLPRWSEERPGYSSLLGFYAFGLEEAGDYARAEAMGREALARQPFDAWAHHAVAHVMEMQGRAADGIGWMQTREPYWSGDASFFKVHNWWHKALFHLDVADPAEALAVYDWHVRQDDKPLALGLVDAASLLWRMHCAGYDVGERWEEVASAWEAHADGRLYPFNDWHAAMAYLGAGRNEDVERLVAACRAAAEEDGETARWIRVTGLPLIEGFRAFAHGAYAEAVTHLHPARMIANTFGGSHAQRDVIDWTLSEAAIRAGMADTAEALAHERLALKPHSPVNLDFLTRARTGEEGATLVA